MKRQSTHEPGYEIIRGVFGLRPYWDRRDQLPAANGQDYPVDSSGRSYDPLCGIFPLSRGNGLLPPDKVIIHLPLIRLAA
jgi:hypothetical protein